jgi:hypothetical protein
VTAPKDPVGDDIRSRNPDTGDQVAGEQVLADDPAVPEPRVADDPDELLDESKEKRQG